MRNTFHPELIKTTLPSMIWKCPLLQIVISGQNQISVYPDKRAHYEPSHQDLLFAQVSCLVCRTERDVKRHPILRYGADTKLFVPLGVLSLYIISENRYC